MHNMVVIKYFQVWELLGAYSVGGGFDPVVIGKWVVFIRFRWIRGGVLLTSNVSCPRQILAILFRQEWELA
jgi:hypothetical protein